MIKHINNCSTPGCAVMSPYPTVVTVAIAKYTPERYLHHRYGSVLGQFDMYRIQRINATANHPHNTNMGICRTSCTCKQRFLTEQTQVSKAINPCRPPMTISNICNSQTYWVTTVACARPAASAHDPGLTCACSSLPTYHIRHPTRWPEYNNPVHAFMDAIKHNLAYIFISNIIHPHTEHVHPSNVRPISASNARHIH